MPITANVVTSEGYFPSFSLITIYTTSSNSSSLPNLQRSDVEEMDGDHPEIFLDSKIKLANAWPFYCSAELVMHVELI